MADIALVFHWGPREFEGMSLAEIARWREKARRRWEPEE